MSSRTGATGYIGGEVLHSLHQAHPDYKIVALIRDEQKASRVLAAYPKVRVVLADLDNVDIVEQESRKAHVVIRESYLSLSNGFESLNFILQMLLVTSTSEV